MTTWSDIIDVTSHKVLELSRQQLADILAEDYSVSVEIGSQIDRVHNRISRKEYADGVAYESVRSDQRLQEWEATFSVINMGAGCVVRLACSGMYLQAVALLRQELEGVAQLHHVLSGKRGQNRTRAPKVNHLEEEVRSLYAELSQGAHLATHEFISLQAPAFDGFDRQFSFLPHGSNILPQCSIELARAIIEFHVRVRRLLLSDFVIYIDTYLSDIE